ncbi:MAG: hypothetical protein ACI9F9_002243 [Candidatus Paceibacteria bacterium]|jgi:hypothetical protein
MSDSDQFEYGDELPRGILARTIALLVLVVFVLSIYGTGVLDTLYRTDGAKLIGAELDRQKKTRANADLWDGSLARLIEDDFRERSRVRSIVLPTYAYLQFVHLGEVSGNLLIGPDSWMFLEHRISLSPLSDKTLAGSLRNVVIAVDRRTAGNGVDLTVLPIPRKSYVARGQLPAGVDGRHLLDDLLIDGLLLSGVGTVDLRETFTTDDPREIYFKLDTHWTPNAARLAAQEMARVAGLLVEPDQRLGELGRKLPKDRGKGGFASLRSIGVNPKRADLTPMNLREPSFSDVQFPLPEAKRFALHESDKRFALAGTSFSRQEDLAKVFSHYVGEVIFDGGREGQPFMNEVQNVLGRYSESGLLKHLFWEIPVAVPFNLFSARRARYSKWMGDAFKVYPAAHLEALHRFPEEWKPGTTKQGLVLSKVRRKLVRTPLGAVAHTGDGVAALSLRGEVLGKPAMLAVQCEYQNYELELMPGAFDVALPLLSHTATASRIVVSAWSAQESSLRLDEATLVHQPVGESKAPLRVQPFEGGVRLIPDAPLLLGQRAALVLANASDGPQLQKLVIKVFTVANVKPNTWRFDSLLPGGHLLLDLGSETGRELTRVKITAQGGAWALDSAWISGSL